MRGGKYISLSIFITFLILVSISHDVRSDKSDVQVPDSVQTLREEYSSDALWEDVVSFPGEVVYFPFQLMFKGIYSGIVWANESEDARWLRRLLSPEIRATGILPAYSSRSGVGLTYFNSEILSGSSEFTFTAQAGEGGRSKFQLRFNRLPLYHPAFYWDFAILYRYLTHERFYGIGPSSPGSAKTNFAHEIVSADLAPGFSPVPYLNIRLHAGFEQNNILPGKADDSPSTTEVYTAESLPGLDKQLKLFRSGVSILMDRREVLEEPFRGSSLYLSWFLYNHLRGTKFGFWKIISEYQRITHLFYGRYLNFRLGLEITEPLQNRQIPFFHLGELGREETIRGYERGRYRAPDMIFASTELIYPVWRYLHGVVFIDGGEVQSHIFKEFTSRNIHWGFGGGLRLIIPGSFLVRLEVGFSKDGHRYYLNLNSD